MVIVKHTNKFGLVYAEVWFCDEKQDLKDVDVVSYSAVSSLWKGFKKNHGTGMQNSLINDLTQSEEELFNEIQSRTRTKIRKAEKEGVEYKIFVNDEITDDLISDFCKTYVAMYSSKGKNATPPNNMFKFYIDAKALSVSVAYYNGEPIVYHSYVFDAGNARLLHSCSDFRNDDELKNIIGLANNGLHWFDMKHFKNNGLQNYDWGGIASIENPNGIDIFKMKFAGRQVTYFNIMKNITFKAKILNFIKMFVPNFLKG